MRLIDILVATALAKMAQQHKVRHLVLTHMLPEPNDFISRHLCSAGMNDLFDGEIIIAEDGMDITLP